MTKGGSTTGVQARPDTFSVARSLWVSSFFPVERFTEREAWLWLISSAAASPSVIIVGSVSVKLKRGELCVSQRDMAEAWQWHKTQVHRFLERLIRAGMLQLLENVKKADVTTPAVLKVSKYNRFNGDDPESVTTVTTAKSFPPKNPLSKTITQSQHKDSGVLEVEDSQQLEVARARKSPVRSKAQRRPATLITDDFQPDLKAAQAYWLKHGRDDLITRADDEAETFKAHHRAHNTLSADWAASWRTWYVRTPQIHHQPRNRQPTAGNGFEPRRLVSILDEPTDKQRPH